MKATLEFNLPEDEYGFKRANKALDMALALHKMQEELFKSRKTDDLDYDTMTTVRASFHNILEDYGIYFEDILI